MASIGRGLPSHKSTIVKQLMSNGITVNGWKVYDVAVTGISLVATFRATVNSEIKRYGLDGLIARLIEKNSRPLKH
jgi:ABC-type transporter MlaC component